MSFMKTSCLKAYKNQISRAFPINWMKMMWSSYKKRSPMRTLVAKKAIEINFRQAKLPLLRWHKWAKYNLSFQLSHCRNLQWKTILLKWQEIKTKLPSLSNQLNRHQTKCHQASRNRTLIHLHLWCQHNQAQLLFLLLCLWWTSIKFHHSHKWCHLNYLV